MRIQLEVRVKSDFVDRVEDCSATNKLETPTKIILENAGRKKGFLTCNFLAILPDELVPVGREREGLCTAPNSPEQCLDYAYEKSDLQPFSVGASYRDVLNKYPLCPVLKTGRVPH